MPMLKLFKSRLPSCKFIFKSGKEANFIDGKYATDDEDEIAQLEKEAKSGHPHLFIDSKQKEIDSDKLSPLEEIKRKAVEEYLAKQAEIAEGKKDMGHTDQSGKLEGILTTDGVAGVESARNSKTVTGARLTVNVPKK